MSAPKYQYCPTCQTWAAYCQQRQWHTPSWVMVAPKTKGLSGLAIAGITAGCLVGLVTIVATTASLAQGDPTKPNPTVTVTARPNPTVTVTAEPEPNPTVTVTAEPKKGGPKDQGPKKDESNTLVEGWNEIGVDAPDGRYKTVVPEDSSNCYWERAKDDRGGFDSIIANENLDPGARGSITVKDGEFFRSHGCGTWVRVS